MQLNGDAIDKNAIIKGLKLTLIIGLVISSFIIIFTIDKDSLTRVIKIFDFKYISLLFLLIVLIWIIAGARLKLLVNTVGGYITLIDAIIIFLSGSFVSNVTPFASGGGPFQIIFLHKKGINVGKSSTVIVTQFVLRLFFFGILTPIFFVFFHQSISPGALPSYLFYFAFGIGVLFSLFIIIFTLVPEITNKLIKKVFEIKKINYFLKNSQRAKRFLVKGRRELREFQKSLDLLKRYKLRLLAAGLLTIVYWSLLFMVIPVILSGLDLNPEFLKAYIMQTIFYLVLPYMPSPGGSGIAEIGFATIFVSFIPGNFIGLVTFTWRLFTFYLVLLIGGILAFKEINFMGSKENE